MRGRRRQLVTWAGQGRGPDVWGEPDHRTLEKVGGEQRWTPAVWAQGPNALSTGTAGRSAWNAVNIALNPGTFRLLGPPQPYHLRGMVSVSP